MIEILACIEGDAPRFIAGIVLWDDRVVEAAPIIGFMKKRKWSRDQVRDYCERKGLRISIVHQMKRPDAFPRRTVPPSSKARSGQPERSQQAGEK